MDSQNNCIYRFYLWVDCYKLWEFEEKEKKQQERQRDPLALIITACIEKVPFRIFTLKINT